MLRKMQRSSLRDCLIWPSTSTSTTPLHTCSTSTRSGAPPAPWRVHPQHQGQLHAEMHCDLADYTGMGQQPSGLRLASLRGPHLTINFWTTTLVSLRYPLGLILSYFSVTRIPLISSTSAPNPKSWARGHLIISTFSPWFLTIYPFVSLISFPSHYHHQPLSVYLSALTIWLCFYATRWCAVLIPCDYLLFLLYSSSRYK